MVLVCSGSEGDAVASSGCSEEELHDSEAMDAVAVEGRSSHISCAVFWLKKSLRDVRPRDRRLFGFAVLRGSASLVAAVVLGISLCSNFMVKA